MSNNPNFTLDDTTSMFCLPLGANIECWREEAANTDINKSTFVLTFGTTGKVYGSAISFYEEYDEELLTEEQRSLLRLDNYKEKSERRIMANKCICLLSQWPFFDAFEKFLFFIYKRLLMGPFDIPLERYISHFLYSVPFPSPERPRILVQLSGDRSGESSNHDIIALYQPQELALPRYYLDVNFFHLHRILVASSETFNGTSYKTRLARVFVGTSRPFWLSHTKVNSKKLNLWIRILSASSWEMINPFNL